MHARNLAGLAILALLVVQRCEGASIVFSQITQTNTLVGTNLILTSLPVAGGTKTITLDNFKRALGSGTEVSLGTIANGATATLPLSTNATRATYSGATATISLPSISSTTNSYQLVHFGTNTSGGTLAITHPSLLRDEISGTSLSTLITVADGAGFRIIVDSVGGVWSRISASGDVLSVNVGGYTGVPTSVLTCDTATTYDFGDNWSGLVTLTNALRANGASGLVTTFTYMSNDDIAPELTAILFSRPVTLTSANTPFLVSNADMVYCLGSFKLTAQDYIDLGTNRVSSRLNLNFAVANTFTNRNLYLAFISENSLHITNQPVCTIGILQD